MSLRSIRLNKGWSQEQLAEISGLSVRTVQRIEQGHKPGLETVRSLASALDVDVPLLRNETTQDQPDETQEKKAVRKRRKRLLGYKIHLAVYGYTMLALLILNAITYDGAWWVIWPALGWGLAVALHGGRVPITPRKIKRKLKSAFG